jgi:hypothetical protein
MNMESSLVASFENETSRSAGGIHLPEVAIKTLNPVPLLPAKQQKYFYTTPDATIGISSEGLFDHLLDAEHTDNFEYGGPNRLGTQAAYLNIPHTVQRNLAPLVLPNAKESEYGNEPFALPFPHLQKGDIAFYLRLENDWNSTPVQQSLRNPSMYDARTPLALVCRDWASAVHTRKKRKMDADEIGKSLMMSEGSQVFVNLQTVNYILHGIQQYGGGTEAGWRDCFWHGFGLHRLDARVRDDAEKLCTHVVRNCMAPFGVITSEVKHSSDQGVAMVVDGRVECMRNYWASFTADGLSLEMPQAGDELILVLERVAKDIELKADSSLEKELDKWTYMLPNHDSAGVSSSDSKAAKMVFPLKASAVADASGGAVIWQLMPSFASMTNRACWERGGYWRLGMVY